MRSSLCAATSFRLSRASLPITEDLDIDTVLGVVPEGTQRCDVTIVHRYPLSLRYPAAAVQSGSIDVDVNYMYCVPLWLTATMDSHSPGGWRASGIPVVDIHELAAGKVATLLARRRARNLFDSRMVLSMLGLNLRGSERPSSYTERWTGETGAQFRLMTWHSIL